MAGAGVAVAHARLARESPVPAHLRLAARRDRLPGVLRLASDWRHGLRDAMS